LVDMVDNYKDMLNTIIINHNVNVIVDADKGLIQIQLLT